MSKPGGAQIQRKLHPNPNNFAHRKDITTQEELVIALQMAFNRGFDEGPHWAQVQNT